MLTIIVKGEVVEKEWNTFYLVQDDESYSLGGWALPYTGKAIVISLEEVGPVLNHNLKELLVPA